MRYFIMETIHEAVIVDKMRDNFGINFQRCRSTASPPPPPRSNRRVIKNHVKRTTSTLKDATGNSKNDINSKFVFLAGLCQFFIFKLNSIQFLMSLSTVVAVSMAGFPSSQQGHLPHKQSERERKKIDIKNSVEIFITLIDVNICCAIKEWARRRGERFKTTNGSEEETSSVNSNWLPEFQFLLCSLFFVYFFLSWNSKNIFIMSLTNLIKSASLSLLGLERGELLDKLRFNFYNCNLFVLYVFHSLNYGVVCLGESEAFVDLMNRSFLEEENLFWNGLNSINLQHAISSVYVLRSACSFSQPDHAACTMKWVLGSTSTNTQYPPSSSLSKGSAWVENEK